MTIATTILAPDEIPSTKGPAMGFSKKVWSRKPDRLSAPPSMAAMRIRGSLMRQMISTSLASPSFVSSISKILEIGMWTFPELILTTMITKNAMASTINTVIYRVRRLRFSWLKLSAVLLFCNEFF